MADSENKSSPVQPPKNNAKAHGKSASKQKPAKTQPTVAESTSQPNGTFQRYLVLLRASKFGDKSDMKSVQTEAEKILGKKLSKPSWKSANWLPDGEACYLPNLHVVVLSLAREQIGLVGKFAANEQITQFVVPERTMKVHVDWESLSAASSPSTASPHLP